jgi:hypothetical protein
MDTQTPEFHTLSNSRLRFGGERLKLCDRSSIAVHQFVIEVARMGARYLVIRGFCAIANAVNMAGSGIEVTGG